MFGDIVITKLMEDTQIDWTIRDLKIERVSQKLLSELIKAIQHLKEYQMCFIPPNYQYYYFTLLMQCIVPPVFLAFSFLACFLFCFS